MSEPDIVSLIGYCLGAFGLGFVGGYLHRAYHRFMELI